MVWKRFMRHKLLQNIRCSKMHCWDLSSLSCYSVTVFCKLAYNQLAHFHHKKKKGGGGSALFICLFFPSIISHQIVSLYNITSDIIVETLNRQNFSCTRYRKRWVVRKKVHSKKKKVGEKEREAFRANIHHAWVCWTFWIQYETPPFPCYSQSCPKRF